MQLALLISAHNEADIIEQTILNIKNRLQCVGIVQSGDHKQEKLQKLTKLCRYGFYHSLPNLAGTVPSKAIGAASLSRNFALLSREVSKFPLRFCIYITGDTAIGSLTRLFEIIMQMTEGRKDLACSQAWGHEFHAAHWTDQEIEETAGGGREQKKGMIDFMPQLFIVRHSCLKKGLFQDIPITNKWCTEQCLGDAFKEFEGGTVKAIGKQLVFSGEKGPYGLMYVPKAGILYQAKAFYRTIEKK